MAETENAKITTVEHLKGRDTFERAFIAKLTLAEEPACSYYSELKNELLRYKKVRSSLSRKADTFFFGRDPVVKMTVRGKTLVVYFAVDPNSEGLEKYRLKDNSARSSCKKTPASMKIKSDRGCKWAKDLIALIMQNYETSVMEDYQEIDYRPADQTHDELMARGLITVKPGAEDEAIPEGMMLSYDRSFLAKLITAGEVPQACYGIIKNHVLSYKKARSRIAWKGENFTLGRNQIIKLAMRGKTLVATIFLDEKEINTSRYKFFGVDSDEKKSWVKMKVKSERTAKFVCKLVSQIMEKIGAKVNEEAKPVDYTMPYRDDERLIDEGFIKVKLVKAMPSSFGAKPVAQPEAEAQPEEAIALAAVPVPEEAEEVAATEQAPEEVAEEPVEEVQEEVAEEETQPEEVVEEQPAEETVEEAQEEPVEEDAQPAVAALSQETALEHQPEEEQPIEEEAQSEEVQEELAEEETQPEEEQPAEEAQPEAQPEEEAQPAEQPKPQKRAIKDGRSAMMKFFDGMRRNSGK